MRRVTLQVSMRDFVRHSYVVDDVMIEGRGILRSSLNPSHKMPLISVSYLVALYQKLPLEPVVQLIS